MTDVALDTKHNQPPDDAEILRDRLATEHAKIVQRAKDLLAAAGRVPEVIDSDQAADTLSDFLARQVGSKSKGCIGELTSCHTAAKAPFLEGGRIVDGFFKKFIDDLDKMKRTLNARLTAWDEKKAEVERKRRIEQERIAREAAERAAREAAEREKALADEKGLDEAIAAEQAARAAQEAAEKAEAEARAKTADISRTRTDYGTTRSLRSDWRHRKLDRATLDLEALRPHLPEDALDKAVRSFIKANKPDSHGGAWPKPLRGVEIYEHKETVSL